MFNFHGVSVYSHETFCNHVKKNVHISLFNYFIQHRILTNKKWIGIVITSSWGHKPTYLMFNVCRCFQLCSLYHTSTLSYCATAQHACTYRRYLDITWERYWTQHSSYGIWLLGCREINTVWIFPSTFPNTKPNYCLSN